MGYFGYGNRELDNIELYSGVLFWQCGSIRKCANYRTGIRGISEGKLGGGVQFLTTGLFFPTLSLLEMPP